MARKTTTRQAGEMAGAALSTVGAGGELGGRETIEALLLGGDDQLFGGGEAHIAAASIIGFAGAPHATSGCADMHAGNGDAVLVGDSDSDGRGLGNESRTGAKYYDEQGEACPGRAEMASPYRPKNHAQHSIGNGRVGQNGLETAQMNKSQHPAKTSDEA